MGDPRPPFIQDASHKAQNRDSQAALGPGGRAWSRQVTKSEQNSGRQSRGPEAGLGRGQPGAVSPWRHDARDCQMRLKGPGGRALPPVATLPLTAR